MGVDRKAYFGHAAPPIGSPSGANTKLQDENSIAMDQGFPTTGISPKGRNFKVWEGKWKNKLAESRDCWNIDLLADLAQV